MCFFTEGSSSFPLPFKFNFCKCHHWMDSQTPVLMVLGSWFLQELPSAAPKPRKLETLAKNAFQVLCCLHHSGALPTQALDHSSTAQMSLPTAPATPLLPTTTFLMSLTATTTFLLFLTSTRPLVLLSVHSTSLPTSNPSWGTFQPGKLAELLKGHR